jgi:hypothetical protein
LLASTDALQEHHAMNPLLTPRIVACYFDIGFVPPLAAMQLAWPTGDAAAQCWTLPSGEAVSGPPPARFGLHVRRQADDAYAVTLLWDSHYRQWFSLRRRELQASSLGSVLAALGTPLEYLLDQPVGPPDRPLPPDRNAGAETARGAA